MENHGDMTQQLWSFRIPPGGLGFLRGLRWSRRTFRGGLCRGALWQWDEDVKVVVRTCCCCSAVVFAGTGTAVLVVVVVAVVLFEFSWL